MAFTGFKAFFSRLPVFPLFAGVSLAFSLLIPTIFETGQKPAARSRYPEMERAAIIVLAVTILIAAVCWFLCQPSASEQPRNSAKESSRRIQFGLRGLLIAITLLAGLLAAAPWMNAVVSSAIVIVSAVGILTWSCFQNWPVRSRSGALLASMFLPFTWLILYNKPFGHVSGLIAALPIGPALLPATLASGHIDDSTGIAASFIVIELMVGVWLTRRGGKLSIAYLMLVLLFSCFNSLLLHVLYRV